MKDYNKSNPAAELVHDFIQSRAKTLAHDEKEDLQQDIYVALLEAYGDQDFLAEDVHRIALVVLAKFQVDRRSRSLPTVHCTLEHEDTIPDPTTPNLDLRLDLETTVPLELRQIAIELFVYEWDPKQLAFKYKKSLSWAYAVKKKIQQLISNLIKEPTLCL